MKNLRLHLSLFVIASLAVLTLTGCGFASNEARPPEDLGALPQKYTGGVREALPSNGDQESGKTEKSTNSGGR